MLRKALAAILCLVIISSMTSCWDSREIDDWAYVFTIGIDKGISDKLRFTVQIPTLKGPSGTKGGQGGMTASESEYAAISVDCPTMYAGVNMINSSLSRTLNYMHADWFIVSEEMAKQGISPFMNGIRRVRQARRIMHFFVVKGQASNFIESFKPILGTSLTKVQESFMSQEKETGYFDETSFGDMLDNIKSTKVQPSCPLAAVIDFSAYKPAGSEQQKRSPVSDYIDGDVPVKGGNNAEFMGTALFAGDRLVGELTGDETRVMLMAKGEFRQASIALPDPLNSNLTVSIDMRYRKNPSVKVVFNEGMPFVYVKLFLEGNLENLQSDINYESENLMPVLEQAYKDYIKEKLDKTIKKLQDLNCDCIGFGKKAIMEFSTIQQWEEYDWLKHFRDAKVSTEVEFIIRRTGLELKTSPTKPSGEESK